ncbi:MAG: hypothetical protein J1E82_04170 [Muribaculaceae bacterium]|nr:hypothetical protein [Muribaculaceae bacterium]
MRKIFKLLLGFMISLSISGFLFSCNNTSLNRENHGTEINNDRLQSSLTVFLIPLDGIKIDRVNKLKKEFENKYQELFEKPCLVEVLDPWNIPDSCFSRKFNRYLAPKMIGSLKSQFKDTAQKRAKENAPSDWEKYFGIGYDYYIIGVTDKDISTAIHGRENFGILGLSTYGGDTSVISTYRLKREQDLWKLAIHEFGHGFFNLRHCPVDDVNCIMADAKGKNPHFELKEDFCDNCRANIK